MIFILLPLLLAPSSSGLQETASIVKYEFENIGTGPYQFQYATSDGQTREERGELKNENTEDEHIVVHGSYSYIGADGVTYTVKYTADEAGFHPEGDHIKVPPFVPWIKGAHSHHEDGHYHHGHHGDDGKYRPEHHKTPNVNDGSNDSPSIASPPTSPPYPAHQKPSTPFPLKPEQSNIDEDTSAFNPQSGYPPHQKPDTPFPTKVQFQPSEPSPFGSGFNPSTLPPNLQYIPSSTQGSISSLPNLILPGSSNQDASFSKLPSTGYIPVSTSKPVSSVSITPKPSYIPAELPNNSLILKRSNRRSASKDVSSTSS